jgi:hypothetical protein
MSSVRHASLPVTEFQASSHLRAIRFVPAYAQVLMIFTGSIPYIMP